MSIDHLNHMFMVLCRYLLSAGHTIAYGGDPLKDFTEALADIERTYRFADPNDTQFRLVNYVAKYLHNAPAFGSSMLDVMDVVKVPRDSAAGEPAELGPLLDLTEMRRVMLANTDVRVIAGGDLTPGAPGSRRGPGGLEEAYLSVIAGRPLLVIGGFGGASRLIADALCGQSDRAETASLSEHFASAEALRATAEPFTFADMMTAFTPAANLNNNLTPEENSRLILSTDTDEIARLVVASIHRLAASTS
jgi:hypothetical protein